MSFLKRALVDYNEAMKKTASIILRLSLAITFVWIGYLILKNPEAWGGYMRQWAVDLLPGSVADTMQLTGIADIIIGLMFLFTPLVWIAGLLAALHMAVVMITSGITDITARDIAILGASLAIMIEFLPARVTAYFRK